MFVHNQLSEIISGLHNIMYEWTCKFLFEMYFSIERFTVRQLWRKFHGYQSNLCAKLQ